MVALSSHNWHGESFVMLAIEIYDALLLPHSFRYGVYDILTRIRRADFFANLC